jgi:hypothetical protein
LHDTPQQDFDACTSSTTLVTMIAAMAGPNCASNPKATDSDMTSGISVQASA